MRTGEKMLFAFRTILFLLGFVLVAYGMVFFGQYLGEFRDFYFMSGQWDKALVMLVIVLAISYVLRKLLLSVYRKEAGIKRRRR